MEKKGRVLSMALKWKSGAQDARIMGSYVIPSAVKDATELFNDLRKTPRGAVRLFLLHFFLRLGPTAGTEGGATPFCHLTRFPRRLALL
jgi:hypothetical protein